MALAADESQLQGTSPVGAARPAQWTVHRWAWLPDACGRSARCRWSYGRRSRFWPRLHRLGIDRALLADRRYAVVESCCATNEGQRGVDAAPTARRRKRDA